MLQIVDDPNLYEIQIDNWAVGALGLPMDVVMNDLPLERQAYEELLERNVQQDCFVAPEIIEAETKQRLESVIFDSAPMGLTQEPAEENPLA